MQPLDEKDPLQRQQSPVVGSRQRMTTQQAASGLTLQPTQLISQRVVAPVQWQITLMPPMCEGPGSVLPFPGTVDGNSAFSPGGGPGQYGGPNLPTLGTGAAPSSQLQCRIRWGAGGVAFSTTFTYPSLGVTFGVTADNVDLEVSALNPQPIVYSTLGGVPIVGAFMVQGSPSSDDAPLSWMQTTQVAATSQVFYSVKPFAKYLRASGIGAASGIRVAFFDTAGTQLNEPSVAGDLPLSPQEVFRVPSLATIVRISNPGASVCQVVAEWLIGLQ